MANIGKLNVTLVANSIPFSKGMARAQKSAARFVGRMRSFGPSVSGVMSGMFRRTAQLSALMAGGLVFGIAKAAGAIDNLAKSSRKLLGNDGATGTLAALRLAGNLAGIEIATLDKSMEKMLETIAKGGEGDGEALEALERVGITAKVLKQASPEKRLNLIAEGINKIGDAGDKITAARGIFGRGGGGLIELFRGGAAAIDKARRQAELFGLSLSGNAAAGVEKMNDNFTRLGSVVQGTFMQITAQVAPVVSALTDKFIEQIEAVGGVGHAVDAAFNFIVDKSVPVINEIGNIIDAAKRMGGAFDGATEIGVGGNFDALLDVLGKIDTAIDNITLGFLKIKQAYNGMAAIRDGLLAGVTGSEGRARKKAEERMVAGIAPDKQDEFRRRLEKAGGAEVEQVTFGVRGKAYAAEAAKAEAEIKALKKGMAEQAKVEKDVASGAKQGNGLGDRFKAFVFSAQEAARNRLDEEKKITDEIEKQTESIEGRAGQSEHGLTAFGFSGAQSVAQGKNNLDPSAGKNTDFLRQIANNTRNQAAVLA